MKRKDRKYFPIVGPKATQPDLFSLRYRRPRRIKKIIDDTLTAIALAGAGTAKKKPPGKIA